MLEERAVLAITQLGEDAASVQRDWLRQARTDLAEAVSSDPDLALARVRLGRVLWRLGQAEAARAALEAALPHAREAKDAYLAHLFLGRIHEDAKRLDQALAEYRQAVDVHPEAQSAAIALSHALQLTGETEESRQALARGLGNRLSARDAHWDYLVSNARGARELLDLLHREALE